MNIKERQIFDDIFNREIHKANQEGDMKLFDLLINIRKEIKNRIKG